MSNGKVVFVGAGPGAKDLISIRGAKVIAQADIIIWASSLVNSEIITDHKPDALIVDSASIPLEGLRSYYSQAKEENLLVARVHTGDPSIYGATAEQRDLCKEIGIAYETIPGISAYSATAARADIEITVPEVSQSFILTRLEGGRTPMPAKETIAGFATHGTTMAIYLSAARHKELQAALLAGGYPPETPVIVGYQVTWPNEAIWRCRLDELSSLMESNNLVKHTIVMVGPALAKGPITARSHLYHPGFEHEYRHADPKSQADLLRDGAIGIWQKNYKSKEETRNND